MTLPKLRSAAITGALLGLAVAITLYIGSSDMDVK
jgi:hypothetical protein